MPSSIRTETRGKKEEEESKIKSAAAAKEFSPEKNKCL
jgi:hypothetical protein